jgi:hypothetical protein
MSAGPPDYDDLPLMVISSARSGEERLQADAALARRSTRGRHILAAESGHWIPLDAPHLVSDAITAMVEEIRRGGLEVCLRREVRLKPDPTGVKQTQHDGVADSDVGDSAAGPDRSSTASATRRAGECRAPLSARGRPQSGCWGRRWAGAMRHLARKNGTIRKPLRFRVVNYKEARLEFRQAKTLFWPSIVIVVPVEALVRGRPAASEQSEI